MNLHDDFIIFKNHLSNWMTNEFQKRDPNYWDIHVFPSLNEYERAKANYGNFSNLNQLDVRANLRVITKKWRNVLSPQDAPNDIFNYLKETQSIANRFYHASSRPDNEDFSRAYDTIWRISSALGFDSQFIEECRRKRDNVINANNANPQRDDNANTTYNPLLSLSELFEKKIVFRIPDYQRGYSWEKKHIEQFWQDVLQLDRNMIHYIGVLTLDKLTITQENYNNWADVGWLLQQTPEYTPYHIVDGQQRITTMLVLLLCISRKLPIEESSAIKSKYFRIKEDNSIATLFGYETGEAGNNYFKNRFGIQRMELINNNVYTNRLLIAEDYFTKVLADRGIAFCNSILHQITNQLKFNVYELSNELNSSVIFETMNNRGKSLSKLELLKNRLIYLSTKLRETDDVKIRLRNTINRCWATIYDYLGKNKNKPLDDDDFLLNHFFMYYQYYGIKTDLIYSSLFQDVEEDDEEHIAGKFTMNGVATGSVSLITIETYIESIERSIKVWFAIKNPNHPENLYNEQIKKWLDKIERLPYRAFAPCLMAIFLRVKDEERIVSILKTMENFIVKSFFIGGQRMHFKKNYFLGLATDLYHQRLSAQEFSGIIDREVNGIPAITPPRRDFVHRFIKIIDEEEKGFYGWNGINYILYEYELELQENNDSKVAWDRAKTRTSIEHIYPQTPNNEWDTLYNGFSPIQRIRLQSSLGNLLLLRNNLNAHLGNAGFAHKRHHRTVADTYIGYYNGSYSEIEVSRKEQWSPREILARGIKILEFMNRRWIFGLPTELKERKKILRLDFLTAITEDNFVRFEDIR